ncbi:MAG: MFS transporter, partial [Dyella sp.]
MNIRADDAPLPPSEAVAATVPRASDGPAVAVLGGISFAHMLNDMIQSLIPAIYPMLKTNLALDFGQIGLITLAFQLTASV